FLIGATIVASGFRFNDGTYTVTNVSPTALEVAETLHPGDEETETDITSAGKIVVAGAIGGGLTNITLEGDEIEVLAGISIASSLGDVTLHAGAIEIDDGA